MSSSSLLDRVELELDENGEQKFAHYAEATSVTEGYVVGIPVLALCGKLFVPSRDPNRYPICPICKKIVEALFLVPE